MTHTNSVRPKITNPITGIESLNHSKSTITTNQNNKYPKKWDKYPSVTEILSIIAKPGLINWFKNKTKEEIAIVSEKSLNIGSTVHKIINDLDTKTSLEIDVKYPEEVKSCISNYWHWKEKNNITVINSELKMLNRMSGYKGTLDKIANKKNKIILIDWKTSKAIYPEYILQCIAYKYLYEFNFITEISECWIIRLDKTLPIFEPYLIKENPNKLFDVFLNALELYNWYNKNKI